MVLFDLVATGWIFDIRLCENSINQSNIDQSIIVDVLIIRVPLVARVV